MKRLILALVLLLFGGTGAFAFMGESGGVDVWNKSGRNLQLVLFTGGAGESVKCSRLALPARSRFYLYTLQPWKKEAAPLRLRVYVSRGKPPVTKEGRTISICIPEDYPNGQIAFASSQWTRFVAHRADENVFDQILFFPELASTAIAIEPYAEKESAFGELEAVAANYARRQGGVPHGAETLLFYAIVQNGEAVAGRFLDAKKTEQGELVFGQDEKLAFELDRQNDPVCFYKLTYSGHRGGKAQVCAVSAPVQDEAYLDTPRILIKSPLDGKEDVQCVLLLLDRRRLPKGGPAE